MPDQPTTEQRFVAIQELGRLLVRHFELTEGQWDVVVEFQIGVAAVGPSPDKVLPSTVVGVSKVGLAKTTKTGPLTIDAGELAKQG